MQHEIQQDTWKHMAGEAAAELIEEGMVIGLGSGSTAVFMIYALARRISAGLRIIGAVPTSQATEDLAANLNIPLTNLANHPQLDLDIDGADEIDPQLNLIKGGGGALLREKVVASASKRFVVIADQTKLVPRLNRVFPLPIETIPFAEAPVRNRLEALGASVHLRSIGNEVYRTDNGNILLDCLFPDGIAEPETLHIQIRSIVGVVETGLFFKMVTRAYIGGPEGVRILS